MVANELADIIFKNIVTGDKTTSNIYKSWIDSHKYRKNLNKYLDQFNLPDQIKIWQVNPDHPFEKIDELWLEELTELILDNKDIPDQMVNAIKERQSKKEGMEIADSHYWESIYKLLAFEAKPGHKINDLPELISLYRDKLYKIDQALRHINQHLLSKERARTAFLALYKDKMKPYLDRWFELFGNYKEKPVRLFI